MYQIELSPRKATPTQAKKQIAQLIYIPVVVSLFASLNLNISISELGFSISASLVPTSQQHGIFLLYLLFFLSIIIITFVVWCFSCHIVFGLIIIIIFLWFVIWSVENESMGIGWD